MIELEKVDGILERYNKEPSLIIAMLQDIQAQVNYLPEDALRYVAKNLDIPLSGIYRLASFYNAFSLTPKGKHIIRVCMGTACYVKGGERILQSFERKLNIEVGGTTQDLKFSLETVNCLGCCGQSPVVVVDEELYGYMSYTRVPEVLERYE